jgi:hypothetical protein
MKTQKQKLIVGLLLLAMLSLYGSYPSKTEAVSMKSVRDTISSSNVSQANVTHTIMATTTQAVPAGGYIQIVLPAGGSGFSNTAAAVACPSSGTLGGGNGSNTFTCGYTSGLAAGAYTFTITGETNPSVVGSQMLTISSYSTGGTTLYDYSTFRVAIVNSVTVTATVQASLTFTISGVTSTTVPYVNGAALTGSSTYNTIAFGILTPGVEKTFGQRLNVTTNANYGYSVTVAQNQNLTASNGATIAPFENGAAASTTPLIWAAPSGTLGSFKTYGHFGITSADTSLSGGGVDAGTKNPFSGTKYKGFWGTTPIEVMYHNGPSDGLAAGIGSSTVAYSIQISPLQQAGDYTNTLTYVCTPTY